MSDTPPASPGPPAPDHWPNTDLDPEVAAAARAAYAEALDEVAALDPDGIEYLDRAHEIYDPETDGLACGSDDDPGI